MLLHIHPLGVVNYCGSIHEAHLTRIRDAVPLGLYGGPVISLRTITFQYILIGEPLRRLDI